jgi:hypothetical protein
LLIMMICNSSLWLNNSPFIYFIYIIYIYILYIYIIFHLHIFCI